MPYPFHQSQPSHPGSRPVGCLPALSPPPCPELRDSGLSQGRGGLVVTSHVVQPLALLVEPCAALEARGLCKWFEAGGEQLSSPPSLGASLSIQSSTAKVTLERHVLAGAEGTGSILYSLGALSSTVNFICHLITSMGHCSHPPGNVQHSLCPCCDTGRGTRSAVPGSPQGRKRGCLDLPSTSFCCLRPFPHPPHWLPSQTLPARGVEGLPGTHHSWLQP